MKIFVVGFPKAGTSSIHDAIEKAGLKSLHWGWYNPPPHIPSHIIRGPQKIASVGLLMKYAKDQGKPLLYFLSGFDAFTQMDMTLDDMTYWPQLLDVPLLDQQYPNSKFIFNTRPIHKWISSVNRWNNLKFRLTKADLPGLPYGFGHRDQELINWYNWHKANMVKYFGGEKTNKLLVFDIENDKPEILGDFLHIKNIKFGHKNENKRNPAYNPSNLPSSIHC